MNNREKMKGYERRASSKDVAGPEPLIEEVKKRKWG